MAGDRGCGLILQAAAEGVVDFSEADILDRWWWRRLRLLLGRMEVRSMVDVLRIDLDRHLAALARTDDPDASRELAEKALSLRNQIARHRMPWLDVGPTDPEEIAHQMRGAYEEEFGDPNDPAYQEEVDRLVEYWERLRKDREVE